MVQTLELLEDSLTPEERKRNLPHNELLFATSQLVGLTIKVISTFKNLITFRHCTKAIWILISNLFSPCDLILYSVELSWKNDHGISGNECHIFFQLAYVGVIFPITKWMAGRVEVEVSEQF